MRDAEIAQVPYGADDKTPDTDMLEKATSSAEPPHGGDIDDGLDPALIKHVTRRIDLRLIPVLAAMYCISLIDRTNLAVARAANNVFMDKDLGTGIGNRYSIVTLLFFIPYILLEIPIGLRKFGARYWLGSAVMAWGIVMIGMGLVKNWAQLAGLRALLGAFESALFPGAAFLISCWYPRRQMATRSTFFYTVSNLGSAFAKALGYCFSLLHGRAGLAGWSWVFVIYGVVTVVVGFIGILFLVDFPDKATFLTAAERDLVLTRIQRDRNDAEPDPLTWAKILYHLRDAKLWLLGLLFYSAVMPSYAFSYFLPSIFASMGWGNVESMLLGAPAYLWATIPAMISASIADRCRLARGPVIMFNTVCLLIGVSMFSQLPTSQKGARYAGIFICVGGAVSNVPLVLSWAQTAIRSQSKRGLSTALLVAWGGIGGITAPLVFINREAKRGYPTGIFFCLGLNAMAVCVTGGLHLFMRRQNRRADAGEIVIEGADDFRYQP